MAAGSRMGLGRGHWASTGIAWGRESSLARYHGEDLNERGSSQRIMAAQSFPVKLCKLFLCRGRSRMQGRGASPVLPPCSILAAPRPLCATAWTVCASPHVLPLPGGLAAG